MCADACPTSVRGILIFKWSGCLTICELCCVPTSCPVYCLALPLPVSPPPQKSTSKICKLLPVVTSNVRKKQRQQIRKTGFRKTVGFPVPEKKKSRKSCEAPTGWGPYSGIPYLQFASMLISPTMQIPSDSPCPTKPPKAKGRMPMQKSHQLK